MTEDWLGTYPVNKEEKMDVSEMNLYFLSELEGYFGTYSGSENSNFGGNPETSNSTIEEVNVRFPIENVRYQFGKHYTIYKVKEGGYFYLFWGLTSNQDYSKFSIRVIDKLYINKLHTREDFNSISIGDTFADILEIDPWADLRWVNNSIDLVAYSLLDEGNIMVFSCDFVIGSSNNEFVSENQFVIINIEHFSHLEFVTEFSELPKLTTLAWIKLQDYPAALDAQQ